MSNFLSFDATMDEMRRRAKVPAEDQGHQWHLNKVQDALSKITDEASLETLSDPDGPDHYYDFYRDMMRLMGKPVPEKLSKFERDVLAASKGSLEEKITAAALIGMRCDYSCSASGK